MDGDGAKAFAEALIGATKTINGQSVWGNGDISISGSDEKVYYMTIDEFCQFLYELKLRPNITEPGSLTDVNGIYIVSGYKLNISELGHNRYGLYSRGVDGVYGGLGERTLIFPFFNDSVIDDSVDEFILSGYLYEATSNMVDSTIYDIKFTINTYFYEELQNNPNDSNYFINSYISDPYCISYMKCDKFIANWDLTGMLTDLRAFCYNYSTGGSGNIVPESFPPSMYEYAGEEVTNLCVLKEPIPIIPQAWTKSIVDFIDLSGIVNPWEVVLYSRNDASFSNIKFLRNQNDNCTGCGIIDGYGVGDYDNNSENIPSSILYSNITFESAKNIVITSLPGLVVNGTKTSNPAIHENIVIRSQYDASMPLIIANTYDSLQSQYLSDAIFTGKSTTVGYMSNILLFTSNSFTFEAYAEEDIDGSGYPNVMNYKRIENTPMKIDTYYTKIGQTPKLTVSMDCLCKSTANLSQSTIARSVKFISTKLEFLDT